MKIYALLFFMFSFHAQAADICADLRKYYTDFEKQLTKKTLTNCSEYKFEGTEVDLNKIMVSGAAVYEQNDPKDEPLVEKLRCEDVSFLENRARDLESQLNSLMGFTKLVDTIKVGAGKVKVSKKADKQEIQALLGDINTAALLETVIKNPTIFDTMREDDLSTVSNFQTNMKRNCINKEVKAKKLTEICNSLIDSKVNESTLASLKALWGDYNNTKTTEKSALLQSWQEELVINKDDKDKTEYSFVEMNSDVNGLAIETLSEQYKAIKLLPSFSHTKAKTKTLEQLMSKIVEGRVKLASDKSQAAKRLVLLNNDLLERQKLEFKSRLSMIWEEFKPSGSYASDDESQLTILKAQVKLVGNDSLATHLEGALRAVEATKRQVTQLQEMTDCLDKKLDEVDEKKGLTEAQLVSCQEELQKSSISFDKLALQNELNVIKKIKDKITDELAEPDNAKLLSMRNLALESLIKNKCTKSENTSSLSDCGISEIINPEMENIIITGLNVSLMYVKPDQTEIDNTKEACKEEKANSKFSSFCTFATKEVSSIMKPDHKKESFSAPLDPDSRNNVVSEAFNSSLQRLANSIAPLINPPNQGPFYPQSSYGPYTGGGPPSISESLIGSSMASGSLRPYVPLAAQQFTPTYFSYQPLNR